MEWFGKRYYTCWGALVPRTVVDERPPSMVQMIKRDVVEGRDYDCPEPQQV